MKTLLLRLKTSKLWPLTFWALVVSCLIGNSLAQTYPNKPVKVINPWTAGGPADIVARPILNKLSERLGQAVVMENKAGANGVIGSAYVAKSAPDGYTLLFSHVGPIAISPSMQKDMPYNSITDFEPITQVVSAPTVLLVRSDFPAKNFEELIAIIKSKPGKLSYGSVGLGSTTHLAGEMLHLLGGLELLHIPYKGAGPATTALVSGEIDFSFSGLSPTLPFVKAGKLIALGVTSKKPVPQYPGVKTLDSMDLTDFEVVDWNGLLVPTGTPQYVIQKLNFELNKFLNLPSTKVIMEQQGFEARPGSPEQFKSFIKTETDKWSRSAKLAKIKVE